jgi:hypothetical protein
MLEMSRNESCTFFDVSASIDVAISDWFSLKMSTLFFFETSENLQHSTQIIPKNRTSNTSLENVRTILSIQLFL